MGDISEMRGLIVVFCIIAVSITLIALMPTEFYTATAGSPETGSVTPTGIMAWNETYILNITDTFAYTFQIGGWNIRVEKWPEGLHIETYDSWWVFVWNFDGFKWFKDGIEVSQYYDFPAIDRWLIEPSQLDDDFASGKGLAYKIRNSKTEMDVSFAFNETAFDTPSDAYVGNDIRLIFNLDFDDRNTSINALNLIGMLFTASIPNVDPTINLLISFPIWACTGYLVFIFVLRIIGAVFGGGGA